MQINKKTITLLICCVALILLTLPLLGSDSSSFLQWWITILVLGIGFYPLTSKIFDTFSDKGWIFSKVLGIAISGFMAFILIACGLAKFTTAFVLGCSLILIALCWGVFLYCGKKKGQSFSTKREKEIDFDLVLLEEVLFLALFLLWTYFAGCRPEAYGTEKFMDYGFMAAMMRDETLPARDIWYSSGTINYYYGGQYFAVFLTKLSFTRINESYNIMRTMVAAFAFVLPFNMVYHLLKDRKKKAEKKKVLPIVGGLLSGAAVSLAGNIHYVLYGLFGSVFKLSGYEDYWFPSSTRYIGHNPQTNDQCIHEFPSYSFVLGDLHAHVVNIMFVLCFLGILYAWFRKKEKEYALLPTEKGYFPKEGWKSILKEAHIWLLGLFLAMFQFTNYWDFVIYMTVALIAMGLFFFRFKKKGRFTAVLVRAVIMIGVGTIAAIPFNMTFQSMAQGFALAQNHSAFYQLVILWGLPVACVLMLFVFTIVKGRQKKKEVGVGNYISNMPLSDMMALLMGICAIGLVLMPELMYARDIYEEGYSRCNTMFKLTYQAFIMFGMAMIYSIIRMLADVKKMLVKIAAGILLFFFILTCGYFPYAVNCWFGDVFESGSYRCLDATAYLENTYAQDAKAIRWLNENVEGNPVVLEAPGDSYSNYERVSAMTGLPTVRGWHTHEWLWRNDPTDLAQKTADIQTIYTSTSTEEVIPLLKEYGVEYIFVGSCERELYADSLNEALLRSLGEVVFQSDEENGAYIIKVADME